MPKYNKCPKCELNYKPENQPLCTVCSKLVDSSELDDDMFDVCPFCSVELLPLGEEMCQKCARIHRQKTASKVIEPSLIEIYK